MKQNTLNMYEKPVASKYFSWKVEKVQIYLQILESGKQCEVIRYWSMQAAVREIPAWQFSCNPTWRKGIAPVYHNYVRRRSSRKYSQRCYPRSIITSGAASHAIPNKIRRKTRIVHPILLYPILKFNSHDSINCHLTRKTSSRELFYQIPQYNTK